MIFLAITFLELAFLNLFSFPHLVVIFNPISVFFLFIGSPAGVSMAACNVNGCVTSQLNILKMISLLKHSKLFMLVREKERRCKSGLRSTIAYFSRACTHENDHILLIAV